MYFISILISLLLCFSSCKNDQVPQEPKKMSYRQQVERHWQQFEQTRTTVQTFVIAPDIDTTLVSSKGAILFIKANNFIDSLGNTIKEPITIEWLEVNNPKEALDNGLSTVTDKGEILETAGMFYFNASLAANSKQVLDSKEPIRIEVTTTVALTNLKLYKGEWQKDKNLAWAAPKELAKDMTPVPLSAVHWQQESNYQGELFNTNNQAPQKVLTQGYSDGLDTIDYYNNPYADYLKEKNCFAIRMYSTLGGFEQKDLEKTWLATREFDSRLQCLKATCSMEAFLLYLNNTDQALWEVDTKVATLLAKQKYPQASNFETFAQMRCTKLRKSAPLPKKALEASKKFLTNMGYDKYEEQQKLKAIYNYPIAFYVQTNGYYNLDCTINRCVNDCLADVELTIQLDNKNIAPNLDFMVFLLLKDAQSIIKLDQIAIANTHLFKTLWMPKYKEGLIFVRDQKNQYLGYQEISFTQQKVSLAIVPQLIKNKKILDQLIAQYCKPRTTILLKDQKLNTCCDGNI